MEIPEPLRCTFLLSCCTCEYLLIPVLVTLRSNTCCVRQTCRISIKMPRYSPSLPGLPQKRAHVVKIPLSSKSYIIPHICGKKRLSVELWMHKKVLLSRARLRRLCGACLGCKGFVFTVSRFWVSGLQDVFAFCGSGLCLWVQVPISVI